MNKTRIGLWTWWYDNGQKWQEGNYANGERDGTWHIWKRNGAQWKDVVYDNGEFISRKEY